MSTPKENVKITLHWLEKSRSQRIVWLLEELNLPYELKVYKRGPDMLAEPALKQVHPLGKSPVIAIQNTALPDSKEVILAESANIVEYLSEYFGKHLIPKKYKDGLEGQVGGETEEYLRYRVFMHYAEGSLMTILIVALVTIGIREAPVPFFVKPITRIVASRVEAQFVNSQTKLHFEFIEQQLATAPGGGPYMCGKELTGVDIMLVYPLSSAMGRIPNLTKQTHPNIFRYVELLENKPAYKKAVQRIIDETGEFSMDLQMKK